MRADRRRRSTGLLALIGLATLLAVAGCAPAADSGRTPIATALVDLPPSYRFEPAEISVQVGTTVEWTNSDNFSHSVQFTGGELPSEPLMMQPGESASFTFDQAGRFEYICHLHPQDMRGLVEVSR